MYFNLVVSKLKIKTICRSWVESELIVFSYFHIYVSTNNMDNFRLGYDFRNRRHFTNLDLPKIHISNLQKNIIT